MNLLEQYLNEYKLARGLTRDDHAAETLGITPTHYSRAKRRGYFTDEQCLKIARGIGVHPALIFLARETVKEKNDGLHGVWNDAYSAARQFLTSENKDYRKLLRRLFYRLSMSFVKVQPFFHVPTEQGFCSPPEFLIAH